MNNKPKYFTSIPFLREWRILSPYLYRYMDKNYVEDFFNHGKLRISSFNNFAKHDDKQRKDTAEGVGLVNIQDKENKQNLFAVVQDGIGSYVLCSSLLYSKKLSEDFKTNSGFRIDDIQTFTYLISSQILGFIGGIEGFCHYVDGKSFDKVVDNIPNNRPINQNPVDFKQDIMMPLGHELLFRKGIDYSNQYEYRLIWNTSNKMSDYIDIECKEATKYCTKFEDCNEIR